MRNRLGPVLRLLGAILALACVGWIVWRFLEEGIWQRVVDSPHAGELLWSVLLAIPIYCLGLCLLGLAWWSLLRAFSPGRLPLRPLFAIYAVTQFAKYLPGNVGQFVGRHVLSRRFRIGHPPLLMATLVEAGFLVLAALVWAGNGLYVAMPWLPVRLSSGQMLAVVSVALIAGVACTQVLRQRHAKIGQLIPLWSSRWLAPVWILHLSFFALMSACLMLSAKALLPEADDIWLLPAAAATSWIAGFLVIGAPAGLGVREMVFLAILHGRLPEADILVLAAAFRAMTFGGDVMLLLLGALLGGMSLTAGDEAASD